MKLHELITENSKAKSEVTTWLAAYGLSPRVTVRRDGTRYWLVTIPGTSMERGVNAHTKANAIKGAFVSWYNSGKRSFDANLRQTHKLTEEWSKDDERRSKEWTGRAYNVSGHGNDWTVVNRFTDETHGHFNNKEEAWAEADRLQEIYRQGEREYYAKGGRGMMMGDVKMDWNR